jgi:hypothetical protein
MNVDGTNTKGTKQATYCASRSQAANQAIHRAIANNKGKSTAGLRLGLGLADSIPFVL